MTNVCVTLPRRWRLLEFAEPFAEDNMLSSSDAADDRVKLHESLRAALDLIDQAFTLMDSELRLLIWNRAFLQMLDLPPELVQPRAPLETRTRFNAEPGDSGHGD